MWIVVKKQLNQSRRDQIVTTKPKYGFGAWARGLRGVIGSDEIELRPPSIATRAREFAHASLLVSCKQLLPNASVSSGLPPSCLTMPASSPRNIFCKLQFLFSALRSCLWFDIPLILSACNQIHPSCTSYLISMYPDRSMHGVISLSSESNCGIYDESEVVRV